MRYALPKPAPLVSIVIPTKDHVETLDACVMSIAENATYANYEIVLVENNSEALETFACYETLPERVASASEGKGVARVVYWPASSITLRSSTLAWSTPRATICCCSTTIPRS